MRSPACWWSPPTTPDRGPPWACTATSSRRPGWRWSTRSPTRPCASAGRWRSALEQVEQLRVELLGGRDVKPVACPRVLDIAAARHQLRRASAGERDRGRGGRGTVYHERRHGDLAQARP